MVYSMTGFGRCEVVEGPVRMCVEMKSVNHRFLDLNIRMPRKLNMFEAYLRGILKEYCQRGKVDIFISYEDFSEEAASLRYNEALAGEYLKYLNQIADTFGLENDIRVSTLSKYPDVFEMSDESTDEEAIKPVLEKAFRGACEQFCLARSKEGENLRKDLLSKLDDISGYVSFIEDRSPVIIEEYKAKVEAKVKELLEASAIDDSRIAAEVTLYADKICVDEEIVRLKSHVKAVKDVLEKGGDVGRRLDFLAQEMNRESNTILSKSTDIGISDMGINLKTDIEKIREQIQNLE